LPLAQSQSGIRSIRQKTKQLVVLFLFVSFRAFCG